MDLADGILQTEDGYSLKVHKIVSAKQYKYFSALIFSKPRDESSFLIPGLKDSNLSRILSYIYTEKIDMMDYNIDELMVALDYFMMDDLLLQVRMFLKRNLSVDNCVHISTAVQLINREDFFK